jgi:uncharacterized protein with HEPN domain
MNPLEQLERKSRLWHIAEAAEMIAGLTVGRTFDDYVSDVTLRLSTERLLITIGEALSRALVVDRELVGSISDARQIIACRNQLVHNYPGIDSQTIWRIVQDHLPRLLSEVRSLLASP